MNMKFLFILSLNIFFLFGLMNSDCRGAFDPVHAYARCKDKDLAKRLQCIDYSDFSIDAWNVCLNQDCDAACKAVGGYKCLPFDSDQAYQLCIHGNGCDGYKDYLGPKKDQKTAFETCESTGCNDACRAVGGDPEGQKKCVKASTQKSKVIHLK